MNLLSIEAEAALCRKAFEGYDVGHPCFHIHHMVLTEHLTEPAENRIRFILNEKDKNEQALRLHLFRPVPKSFISAHPDWKKANADRDKAYADWKKAREDCQKAIADLKKANPDWKKANADLRKANPDWKKARADWDKAIADWDKAIADWKRIAEPYHAELCPDCTWDGETIFPKEKK